MSWIVKNKSKNRKNKLLNEFILISTPKCGGYTIEKLLTQNNFIISRPKGLDFVGHYSLLDTYARLHKTKYEHITNYLIPYRDSLPWRLSFYNYVKNQPFDSGMYFISNLFNSISYEEYIELLVKKSYTNLSTIENLAFLPRSAFLSNQITNGVNIKNINIYVYDMTNGFKKLFNQFFEIPLEEEVKENKSKYVESHLLSKRLHDELNKYDNIDFINFEPYISL